MYTSTTNSSMCSPRSVDIARESLIGRDLAESEIKTAFNKALAGCPCAALPAVSSTFGLLDIVLHRPRTNELREKLIGPDPYRLQIFIHQRTADRNAERSLEMRKAIVQFAFSPAGQQLGEALGLTQKNLQATGAQPELSRLLGRLRQAAVHVWQKADTEQITRYTAADSNRLFAAAAAGRFKVTHSDGSCRYIDIESNFKTDKWLGSATWVS